MDDEYIRKSDALECCHIIIDKNGEIYGTSAEYDRISELEPVDVVPVIRCKDCENYEFMSNRVPEEREWSCWLFGNMFGPEGYCSLATRREEDG